MGSIKVKNLNGTSKFDKCTEGASWLEHWKNYKHYSPGLCARKGCSMLAEVGGHVKKVESSDNTEYIIPLCKTCNNLSSETIYECGDDQLVPVSHANWPAGKTCKKLS